MKHNICICCNTNNTLNLKKILCKNCEIFIHEKLQLSSVTLSRRLGMKIYTNIKNKCSFCHRKSVVSYKDYEINKKYYICKTHTKRWLKIGCQLGELANFLYTK